MLDWIKRDVFEIDPGNPDPGRVAHRRLNRVEYENTLYELTGIRIDSGDLLPSDDTGYGFDNIADALSISPLVLEKYIEIAGDVISGSIPDEAYELPHQEIESDEFRDSSGGRLRRSLSFADSHEYRTPVEIKVAGPYRIRSPSHSELLQFRLRQNDFRSENRPGKPGADRNYPQPTIEPRSGIRSSIRAGF